jgi:cytoskeleton protein RodZ
LGTFSVGPILRQERLRQGLSLDEIAGRTRISQRFLAAIEAEDFGQLPGVVFTRNFVRQFASALGMEPDPLLAGLPRVDVENAPLPDAAQFARPRRPNPRWASAMSSAVWVILAIGASAGAYVYLNGRTVSGGKVEAKITEKPPVSVVTPAATQMAAPAPVVITPAPTSDAPTANLENHAVQVVLKAREASWVQIIADGKNAFTGTLHPNDSREVAADALVKVIAGNAGGLEISLNGKALDPIGPSGQVRTVRLTAEGPQLVAKPAPL